MYENNDDRIIGPVIDAFLFPGFYNPRFFSPFYRYPFFPRFSPGFRPRRRRRFRPPHYYY